MGISRYFLSPWLAGALDDLERIQKRVTRQRQRQSSDKVRIAELEADLCRVALLTRALAELCLAKGVLTKEELIRQLEEVDLADGKRDQRLQARFVMPGESKSSDPEPKVDPGAKKSKIKRRRPHP